MQKETITTQIFCDNCEQELTHLAENEIEHRSIMLKCYSYCHSFESGENLDFCNVFCANEYLEKHHGIRWVSDNDAECPKEGHFCHKCPQFDERTKYCLYPEFWGYTTLTIPNHETLEWDLILADSEPIIPWGAFE